ncbi:sure-like protein [Eremomyces bilateralis CBS 781.70]|uniref:Sure-like protein n=1 Tax=Eremomyces bilateralis CBS 781.70 TaxID=1392243 RepID=A0A6G1GB59_9PEZI|nr:sure-like protein [Eremomyces bilateralis CBS 781.70]KAF1815273.1 sure-like protein [Eremomyces bilateralis CBS 781.70]
MRLPSIVAGASLLSSACGLNILVNNDDSWAAANIREFYKALKASGHNVLLVAPAVQQSAKGGTVVFADVRNLTTPGEFDSVPAGSPSFGQDPNDSHMWYYNGTPAACTFFALDYVLPRQEPFGPGVLPDLMVSGPNVGSNAGPFVFTLSGSLGAAYSAVERGIPSIAFSAVNSTHRGYTDVADGDTADVAVVHAKLSTAIVDRLAENFDKGHGHWRRRKDSDRLLPLGYGLNVNIPLITDTCTEPNYVQTRLTGGAVVDIAVYNETTGLFKYGDDLNDGVNACINGDCRLPGETLVIKKCAVAVSVFTTDFDAPNCRGDPEVRQKLEGLVHYAKVKAKRWVF